MKLLDIKTSLSILRQKSKNVVLPLTEEDKTLINEIAEYLEKSQIEEYSEKYQIRPGMGMAFIQLGIKKRIAVIVHEETENNFVKYVLVNPVVISKSEEMIYACEGEGCLSVPVDAEGFVLRHARITIKAFDENNQEFTLRAREELAIAIQHELDHMEGMLYYDRINQKNPFAVPENAREI